MKYVWKYALRFLDTPECVSIPAMAKLVLVDEQGGRPCIWFEVNPDAKPVNRYFQTFGTGHPIPDEAQWCGSFLMANGALVFHVYEVNRG